MNDFLLSKTTLYFLDLILYCWGLGFKSPLCLRRNAGDWIIALVWHSSY
ncbi:hypothetical protein DsansV1_C08g0078821 [Dioscorea sansibarensis]